MAIIIANVKQTDNLNLLTSRRKTWQTNMKIFFVESWKDCHKSYTNPFDGGLQCVFEKVAITIIINCAIYLQFFFFIYLLIFISLFILLFIFNFCFLLFSHRATRDTASTVSVALFLFLNCSITVLFLLLENDL